MIEAVRDRERDVRRIAALQRTIVDSAAYGIISTTPEGLVTSFNVAAERLLGFTAEEVVDKQTPALWHDPEEVRARARQLSQESGVAIDPGFEAFVARARRGPADENEWTFIRKDGTRVPVLLSVTALRDETGETTGFVGLFIDLTERKQAERQRAEHVHFLESMDRVNRAIQNASDLEAMQSEVLDVVLSVFDCDRAFLMYPCDPDAAVWRVPMERSVPAYPGVNRLGLEVPMDSDVAQTLRLLLAADGPVKFGPGTPHALPADVSERFGFKCFMSMAIHPKVGKPWQFGIHQCSYARTWTAEEERLFQEIGRRLADSMTTLLAYRDLRDNREKLEEAQRIAQIGYWDRDFVANRIELAEEACRIFGLDPRDRVLSIDSWHERWLSLIHPEDRDKAAQAFAAAMRGGAPYNVDYRVVRPDGETRFIHSEANVTRDASGRPVRMLGMMQDVTDRTRAEEALRISQGRFGELFNKAAIPLCLVNKDGGALDVNTRFLETFGFSRVEIPTLNEWWRLAYPDAEYRKRAQAVYDATLQRALASKTDLEPIEYRVTCKSGDVRTMVVWGSAVGEDLLLTFFDVTERKKAEDGIRALAQQLEVRVAERTAQLEAANQELEAFAYSVSHDLRAPLRHIDGFVALLARRLAGSVDDQARHFMTTISDAVKRMETLIEDLLSFSRMGRKEMSRQKVDLGALVQEVIREFEPETRERTVHWQPAALPAVAGDRAMLRVAFVNLVANALKFTRPRPVAEIEIGFRQKPDETVFFIRDNGVGFDPQYSDKLFGVFQRLHGAAEFEGTGIGLANVRRIITRHGGRTWAEGKVNEGATFYFSLPASSI
jgi:PAS domain S-box-containing protein